MSHGLDWTPELDTFLGICGLKMGSIIVSVVGIMHPSVVAVYLHLNPSGKFLLTVVATHSAVYFLASLLLMVAVLIKSDFLCAAYVWFSFIFVFVCLCFVILAVVITNMEKEWRRDKVLWLAVLLLFLTFVSYGAFVVGSFLVGLEMQLSDIDES